MDRLLEHFTNAKDRNQSGGKNGLELFVGQLVALADDVAAFAVAENDVFAADVFQHPNADLTGERAFFLEVAVLGTDSNVGAFEDLGDRVNVNERRADRDVGVIDVFGRFLQAFDQGDGSGTVHVHFPVTSDERTTHFQLLVIYECESDEMSKNNMRFYRLLF